MIKHIVSWKLRDEDKAKNAAKIKIVLESLKAQIPQCVELEVGVDFNQSNAAHDVVLYSTFETKADLDVYQNHPRHLEAVEFVKSVVKHRIVVDYEV